MWTISYYIKKKCLQNINSHHKHHFGCSKRENCINLVFLFHLTFCTLFLRRSRDRGKLKEVSERESRDFTLYVFACSTNISS